MKLGEKIRAIRKRKKITQAEVADLLEISQRAYSKIENGETNLKVKRLDKIAQFLNVNTAQFLDEGMKRNVTAPVNDKERILYEDRIQHQEKEINFLKNIINVLKG